MSSHGSPLGSSQEGLIGAPVLTYEGPMIFKPIGPSRQFRILADRQHDNEDSNGCRLVSVTCDGVSRDLDSIFLHGLGSTFDNHQNFLAHPEFLEDGTTAYNFDWKLTAHKMISAAEYLAARNESTRTGNAADIIKNISLRFDVTCHEAVQPNEVWPLQHNVALDVEIQAFTTFIAKLSGLQPNKQSGKSLRHP